MRFAEHWRLKTENFLGIGWINQGIDIPRSPENCFFRGMIIEQVQWLVAREEIVDHGNILFFEAAFWFGWQAIANSNGGGGTVKIDQTSGVELTSRTIAETDSEANPR